MDFFDKIWMFQEVVMSELMGILGMGMAFLAGFLLGGLRRRGKAKEEEGTLEAGRHCA